MNRIELEARVGLENSRGGESKIEQLRVLIIY
jgi:hypothetical protein